MMQETLFAREHDPSDVVYTPDWCASDMIDWFKPSGRVLDPCKGAGAFFDKMPDGAEWCEIREGRDFFEGREIPAKAADAQRIPDLVATDAFNLTGSERGYEGVNTGDGKRGGCAGKVDHIPEHIFKAEFVGGHILDYTTHSISRGNTRSGGLYPIIITETVRNASEFIKENRRDTFFSFQHIRAVLEETNILMAENYQVSVGNVITVLKRPRRYKLIIVKKKITVLKTGA
jgi:hypothetical protein